MALQTFYIHSAERIDGGWHCRVECSGKITAMIPFDRVPGAGFPMMMAIIPRFRGNDCECNRAICNCNKGHRSYHGTLRIDEIDMTGVTSVTIDGIDKKTDKLWGYTRDGEFSRYL